MYIKVDIIFSICFMLHCIIIMLSYDALATCERYRWAVLFSAMMCVVDVDFIISMRTYVHLCEMPFLDSQWQIEDSPLSYIVV